MTEWDYDVDRAVSAIRSLTPEQQRAAFRELDGPEQPGLRGAHERLHAGRGLQGAETFETCVWCASFRISLAACIGDS